MGIAQPNLVANDGLHPSGIQYSKWVKLMLNYIDSNLVVTSVQKNKINERIAVYPNPSTDDIMIFSNQTGNKALELYDNTGILILRKEMPDKMITVSVNDLSRGMYIVKIISENGYVIEKVIKE